MTFFDVHTHIDDNDKSAIQILSILPEDTPPEKGIFSAGIHPWFIKEETLEKELSLLAFYATKKNCAAIGECGLDRANFRRIGNGSKSEGEKLQQKAFKIQAEIASDAGLPMIIHCVRCVPEIISVRKSFSGAPPWIIHGFRDSAENANSLIKAGFYLSFGSLLLGNDKSTEKNRILFASIRGSRILLETDNCGNNSLRISEIYKRAAELRRIPEEVLVNTITENVRGIFKELKK